MNMYKFEMPTLAMFRVSYTAWIHAIGLFTSVLDAVSVRFSLEIRVSHSLICCCIRGHFQ